jgi:hypothetical protein
MQWLEPWVPIADLDWPDSKKVEYSHAWERQLKREVGLQHVLHGEHVVLIARRFDCDDALFQLGDGRVADVHLTWSSSPEGDPRWPGTQVFENIDNWATNVMKAAHDEWEP